MLAATGIWNVAMAEARWKRRTAAGNQGSRWRPGIYCAES